MPKSTVVALAAIFIASMSGPSAPSQVWSPDPSWVEPPPARYDHAPDRPFVVIIGAPAEVHRTCGGQWPLTTGPLLLACTVPAERIVVFPHCAAGQEAYCGALWRHEMAHLNGWRH
jgi:hypothetical protein